MSFRALALVVPLLVPAAAAHAAQDTAMPRLSQAELADLAAMRREGKFSEAIEVLRAHPAVQAREPHAQALYGLVTLDSGENAKAEAILTEIYPPATYMGDDPFVLTLFGRLYASRYLYPAKHGEQRAIDNELGKSETYFARALAAAPDDPEARFGAARTKALRSRKAADAQAVVALKDLRASLPAGMYERYVGETCFVAANALVGAHEYGGPALELLRHAVESRPEDPTICITYARCLIENRDDAAAESQIRRIEKDFELQIADAEFLRGRMKELQGNSKEALQHGKNAVTLSDRNHKEALLLAARVAFAQKDLDEARLHLDRLAVIDAGSAPARILFGKYWLARANSLPKDDRSAADRRRLLELAETELRTAVQSNPFDLDVLKSLESLYEELGDRHEELEQLRVRLKLAQERAG